MKRMILAVFAAVAVAGSAGAQSGVKYPYVTVENSGVIVVLRDSKGGIDESSLFSLRVTESKTGNETSTDNRMSRKFRVQKSNPGKKTWPNAVSYCNDLSEEGKTDWRLPSQRELMMIRLLGGSSGATSGNTSNTGVGIATKPVNTPYIYQQPGLQSFENDYHWTATAYGTAGTSAWYVNIGNGHTYYSQKTNTSAYVRCVRDEW